MPRRRHEEETPEELVQGLEEAPLVDEEEEEEPEEEEAIEEEAPPQEEEPPPAAAESIGEKPKQPRKRAPRRDIGKPHAKPGDRWKDVPPEGDQRWAALISDLKRVGKSPYDVVIRVLRAEGRMVQLPGLIDGATVMGGGNMSPGDALREAVAAQYHEPVARGPMTYNVHFAWKATGQFITRGVFNFPSPEEMWQFRQAHVTAERQRPRRPVGQGEPPWQEGFNGMPSGMPSGMPYGFGGPPAQSSSQGDELAQMRMELQRAREREQYTNGVLAEVLRAQKEGRAPNIQPQGVGAPPPAAPPVQPQGFPNETAIAEKAANILIEKLGLRPGMPGIGVGTPPPTPRNVVEQGKEGISTIAAMVGQLKELKGLGAQISSIFGDEGYEDEPPPPAPAPVVAPPSPDEDLPFQTIPIPESPTLLGQPYRYAVDKKTGGTSWEGILHSNPQIAEKAFEVGGKFLQGLAKFAKGIDVAAAERGVRRVTSTAQVVEDIPPDAADAGVAGTNGAPAGGGWPT